VTQRPILLLEVNEVPLRVYQKYAADSRFPNIARLMNESALIETLIGDEGELSPWCTWPTFHRGLPKEKHGSFHLGQDPATFHGTPIWEEFRKKGLSVGVFGSMQSWPPADPGPGGFYVPDTFSSGPECIPSWLEPVQKFNLGLVRENGRVMGDGIVKRAMSPALWLGLVRAGVRPSTALRAANQLLTERLSPVRRERRVSYQAILFWDIFRKLYDPEHPPALSTFFTNHVASVMHRYWSHVFPEDFPHTRRPERCIHLPTMDFAMKVTDNILGEAFAWQERNPELLLVVANSMGQGTKICTKHQGEELLLQDARRLLALLGVPAGVKQNLAMAPQVALDLGNFITFEKLRELLDTVTTLKGTKILIPDHCASSLSLSLRTPPLKELDGGKILVRGREVPFEEAGMRKIRTTAGTAYHIPEGLVFAHGLKGAKVPSAKPLPAENVKALMMEWAGINA